MRLRITDINYKTLECHDDVTEITTYKEYKKAVRKLAQKILDLGKSENVFDKDNHFEYHIEWVKERKQ